MTYAIKERAYDGWITEANISSGMTRTLILLVELALAPAGSVIVIDELENSLGINCLPAIVDRMLARAGELQFIVTSHHPYIINNIPSEYWRLVRRAGSEVTITPASEIPALNGKSSLDRFIRLINSREFEEGIA
jgi:predicted ATPase